MFCPVCKSELKVTGQVRLETISEHVCDPNGDVCFKDKYECVNTMCVCFKKCCWNKYGEYYTDDFKFSKLIENCCVDKNEAPFGTSERKLNVEIRKKDENFKLFDIYFFYWKVVFIYKADENGNILKRWWKIETIMRKRGGRHILYISGIHMSKFVFREFYINKKKYYTDKSKYNIYALKEDFKEDKRDKRWWKRLFKWYINTFEKKLKKEIFNDK